MKARGTFSPDLRNLGGRRIIVDSLVAHTLTLENIHNRSPGVGRRRLKSQSKNRKNISRNSETKPSLRSKENSKERTPQTKKHRVIHSWRHGTQMMKAREAYNELQLDIVQKENINGGLLLQLRQDDFKDTSSSRKIFFKKIMDHVVRKRIIRDEQFDQLYIELTNRYPHQEQKIRDALVQVVASLDF